jgi:hypothetical protein
VTHRSPLVTLLGLVAAFAIMFGVNLASSAPRNSYAEPPGSTPSATAAATSAASPTSAIPSSEPPASPSPPPSQLPSASETAEGEKFPNKVVYAGRTTDGSASVAVAVLGDRAAAYLCDGHDVESWLRGTVKGNEIALTSRKGAALEAKLTGRTLQGKIKVNGDELKFAIKEAKPPAGLYRARGAKSTIGWIILPDGSQVGIGTSSEDSGPAPKLDPAKPQVTVDGESLQAEPVAGDQDV